MFLLIKKHAPELKKALDKDSLEDYVNLIERIFREVRRHFFLVVAVVVVHDNILLGVTGVFYWRTSGFGCRTRFIHGLHVYICPKLPERGREQRWDDPNSPTNVHFHEVWNAAPRLFLGIGWH